jgi:hypothetical protein
MFYYNFDFVNQYEGFDCDHDICRRRLCFSRKKFSTSMRSEKADAPQLNREKIKNELSFLKLTASRYLGIRRQAHAWCVALQTLMHSECSGTKRPQSWLNLFYL